MNHPIAEYRDIIKTVIKTMDCYRYTNLVSEAIKYRNEKSQWLNIFRQE